jgi:hypothetical protein
MTNVPIAPGLGYPWVSPKVDPLPSDVASAPVGWQIPPVSRETKTHEENPA